jgi:hypothetical protein
MLYHKTPFNLWLHASWNLDSKGRGLSSNLTGTRLTKKFPSFCGNLRSLTYAQQPATHKCPTPDESTTNRSFISCDIIAPFFQSLGFRRGFLPCKNFDEKVICIYNILNSFYIPHLYWIRSTYSTCIEFVLHTPPILNSFYIPHLYWIRSTYPTCTEFVLHTRPILN